MEIYSISLIEFAGMWSHALYSDAERLGHIEQNSDGLWQLNIEDGRTVSIEALTLAEAYLCGKNSDPQTTEALLRNTDFAYECEYTGLSFLYTCDYSEGQVTACYVNVGNSWHEYKCDYDDRAIAGFLETLSEAACEQIRETI